MQERTAQRQIEQLLNQAQRAAEMADRQAQRQIDQQLAQAQRAFELRDREILRESERLTQQVERQLAMQDRQLEREVQQVVRAAQRADVATSVNRAYGWTSADSRVSVPAPWIPQDVADSAWRSARELFNRGEYGQAAQSFRALPTRFPNSAYASEAAYYQAFALFRIGGTTRGGKTLSLKLASGDALAFGGEARLAYHGIDRILAGSSSLLPQAGRINLTLRRVTKPSG